VAEGPDLLCIVVAVGEWVESKSRFYPCGECRDALWDLAIVVCELLLVVRGGGVAVRGAPVEGAGGAR
jgi:cytidine deaminase